MSLLLDIGADLEQFQRGNRILDVENIRDLMAWNVELCDALKGLLTCNVRRPPCHKHLLKAQAALGRYD